MFTFFWYKQRVDPSNFTKIVSMSEWCHDNLGQYGKRWVRKFHLSPISIYRDTYEFRFKRREDFVMFKLVNM